LLRVRSANLLNFDLLSTTTEVVLPQRMLTSFSRFQLQRKLDATALLIHYFHLATWACENVVKDFEKKKGCPTP
jgi:hypothetical protein